MVTKAKNRGQRNLYLAAAGPGIRQTKKDAGLGQNSQAVEASLPGERDHGSSWLPQVCVAKATEYGGHRESLDRAEDLAREVWKQGRAKRGSQSFCPAVPA